MQPTGAGAAGASAAGASAPWRLGTMAPARWPAPAHFGASAAAGASAPDGITELRHGRAKLWQGFAIRWFRDW
eukprot:6139516-Alexandrium_andersonii.AAC.1